MKHGWRMEVFYSFTGIAEGVFMWMLCGK